MSQSYIYESNREDNIINFAKSFLNNTKIYDPDFIHIQGKIQSKDIKDIKNNLKYKSFSNTHRVILIQIDTITIEAQNSMLKMLEESNEDSTIVLSINNPNRLLDTICSRCIIIRDEKNLDINYDIKTFIESDIEKRLEFIESIEDIEDFIINMISYIIRNYNSIDEVKDKLKKLNEIQKSIQNNISKKLLLIDISLNI